MERFKIDEYVVRGKGRDYSVLVFPVDKYMWAYDNRWEIDHYCVDGSKEAFNLLKYAMAILANASDKIIYFPCKQSGIGDHYNENYNLILCTPKAQLRRSSWISIRRKLGPATKKGSFVLQYDRKKLDDYCRKKLMRKYCENLKIKYRLNAVAGNAIEKWHLEELVGENLFMVLSKEECYYNHYLIADDLDNYDEDSEYSIATAMGWIVTHKLLDAAQNGSL